MKKILLLFTLFLVLIGCVSAFPRYLDIDMSETVTRNTSFAKNFDLIEVIEYCDVLGEINFSNPSSETISDIYINFTNTDKMKSNLTFIIGRDGSQLDNGTPGDNWVLHIPELRSGQSTLWQYNLDCSDSPPPFNTSTFYSMPHGLQKKVLAGRNFSITSMVKNSGVTELTEVNLTITAQQVDWNGTLSNFTLDFLNATGDYTNVTFNPLNANRTTWYWAPLGGNLSVGEASNITYVLGTPYEIPTSNTYEILKEYYSYKTLYLISNLTIVDVKAVGDVDINLEKQIIRPSSDANDTNVTWQADADINIPINISYNITKVTLWVTTNRSPLAVAQNINTGENLTRTYNVNTLYNGSSFWNTNSNSWTFNYTDGSDSVTSPPPIIWVRPYYHLFQGQNQIVSTSVTQSGSDIYMKYVYVVNGYWLEVEKNITSQADGQYDINITVYNIGNAWTPEGLTVTVYDFVPSEFTAFAWNKTPNYNSSVFGAGYNGTAFQWDIQTKMPYNASLGPPSSGTANSTWNTFYTVNGTGSYKVSELYIVGLDPRKVDGAGAHEGITVIAGLSSKTKETLYLVAVVALIALNLINFMMTRNISRKLK